MPPLAAAAAIVGKVVASSAILSFAVQVGGSLLLSAAAQALMPKPRAPGVSPRTVSVREPVRPREVVYGRVRKGGTIVFMHTTKNTTGDDTSAENTKGEYLHLVIVLAAHEVKSIGNVYFNGELAIEAGGLDDEGNSIFAGIADIGGFLGDVINLFGASVGAGNVQERYRGKVLFEKRLGRVGQSAFRGLQRALPSMWTSNHRLDGCAAIYLRLKADPEVFPSGIPTVSVDMEGKTDILDPRTGERGYTTNAALCLADYMADPIWGIRATIGAEGGSNEDALIEAANVCDELVPSFSGDGLVTDLEVYDPGTAFSVNAIRGDDVAFRMVARLPETPTDAVLVDMSDGTTGAYVCVRDSGTVLRIRTGSATATATGADCNILDVPVSALPFDGDQHELLFFFGAGSSYQIVLYVDGAYQAHLNNDAWEGENWGGTGDCQFLESAGSAPTGEPTTAWPVATGWTNVEQFFAEEDQNKRLSLFFMHLTGRQTWEQPQLALVDTDGWGRERRYATNGVVTLDLSPKDNIEAMNTAFAGKAAWSAGAWRIHAGAYRSPTVTLTSDDAREAGMKLSTRVSRGENFNGVRGQFISPENDWQPDDFPAYQSATYVAEDGGEEDWLDLSLPFTISPSAAQRLAKIELERQRRQMSVSFAGKFKAWEAVCGQNVMLSYTRWGFDEKPFEVRDIDVTLQDVGDAATLVPDLKLRETSPLVYSWEASEAQIYAAAPRSSLPSAFDPDPPGRPVVTEELYVTRNGAGVKALARLEWADPFVGFLSRYEVEGAFDGGPFLSLGTTTTTTFEVADIDPGDWVFRVRSVTAIGARSAWAERAVTIVGLAAPPVAISGLTLQSAGGLAILKWTQHPDLDVRIGGAILIRHAKDGSGWSNSMSMETLPGSTALAAVPLKPGTYYLAARDSSGILGPVVAVSASGAQALAFSPVDLLQADPLFPGDRDGVGLTTLGLTLTGQTDWDDIPDIDADGNIDFSGGVMSSGTYTFGAGLDFGAVSRVRLRSEVVMAVLVVEDSFDERTGNIDSWADFDGGAGASVDARVEVRITDDDPAGSPSWSDWTRLDSSEIEARGVQARTILTTDDPAYAPVVSELRVSAEEVA